MKWGDNPVITDQAIAKRRACRAKESVRSTGRVVDLCCCRYGRTRTISRPVADGAHPLRAPQSHYLLGDRLKQFLRLCLHRVSPSSSFKCALRRINGRFTQFHCLSIKQRLKNSKSRWLINFCSQDQTISTLFLKSKTAYRRPMDIATKI